ncbi:MAG: class I SAM-dependent methyltransferase [Luteolibacter sp.]
MSYDRFAPFYTFAETLVFGRVLQKARCAGLVDTSPKRVLIIGDGNGRFLERAVPVWPDAQFVSIDASAGMLRQAKKRVKGAHVRFIHADVFDGLHEIQGQTFDVIVTHFFLDCFHEKTLQKLIPTLSKMLTDTGVWYVSDFTGRRLHHRAMLWIMYRFFQMFTETPAQRLPDYRKILFAQGLVPETLGSWRLGFVIAERWQKISE